MINYSSESYELVKQDIDNYIKNNGFYDNLLAEIPAATYNELLDILTQYITYNNYKYNMYRKEGYIKEAILESSIINLASMLGYRLNRYTAPRVKFKVVSDKTLFLKDGYIIGNFTYNNIDYSIVYFGEAKKYEYGDELDFYIAKYNEIEEVVQTDFILKELNPLNLKSIDNNSIHIYVNDILQKVSHNIEDYVIFRSAVDFSKDFYSTLLYITDKQNYFGLNISVNDTLKICWLETDGEIDSLNIQQLNIIDKNFVPLEISSYGTFGDDIEKVRFLAPLYFTTLRRMVTKEDHKYIIKSHELIKDCAVEKILTKPFEGYIYPIDSTENQNYTITINDKTYQFSSGSNDTEDDVIQEIYNNIKDDTDIYASVDSNGVYIKQVNLDLCEFNISVSSNLVLSEEQKFEKAPCCALNVYYIKYNVIDDPIILTTSEQKELSDFIKNYKMVGTTILLNPAKKEEYDLKIKVSLIDNKYSDIIYDEIKKIVETYELKLEQEFKYGEFLAKVANIKVIDGDKIKNIIDYVLPNQETFDLDAKVDTYYKFNLDVEII